MSAAGQPQSSGAGSWYVRRELSQSHGLTQLRVLGPGPRTHPTGTGVAPSHTDGHPHPKQKHEGRCWIGTQGLAQAKIMLWHENHILTSGELQFCFMCVYVHSHACPSMYTCACTHMGICVWVPEVKTGWPVRMLGIYRFSASPSHQLWELPSAAQ